MGLHCWYLPQPAALAIVFGVLTSALPSAAQLTITDRRFAHELLYTGAGMISIEFAPDGRLYVCEKRGRVLTFVPDGAGGYAAEPDVFLDLTSEVSSETESGLLGMALDPEFA